MSQPTPNADCLTPILTCSDIAATIAFFEEKLGFEKRWDWGEPVDFACVASGKVEVFLCQDGQGVPGTWLMVFVPDVTAYHDQVAATGATIHSPLADYPWGCREFTVVLPDHHIIRFGGEIPCDDDEDEDE